MRRRGSGVKAAVGAEQPLPDVDCKAAAPRLLGIAACTLTKLAALLFASLAASFASGLVSSFPIQSADGAKLAMPRPIEVSASGFVQPRREPLDLAPRSASHHDYGLPKDHPYTPPAQREASQLDHALRTPEYYASKGCTIHSAGSGALRTHPLDPDPVVVTLDGLFGPDEAAKIIAAARPQMRRAGVTADNGGTRKSTGRSNNLAWLSHRHDMVVEAIVVRHSCLAAPCLQYSLVSRNPGRRKR